MSFRNVTIDDITYMWNLKNNVNKCIRKKETDAQRQRKQTSDYERGEGRAEGQIRSRI